MPRVLHHITRTEAIQLDLGIDPSKNPRSILLTLNIFLPPLSEMELTYWCCRFFIQAPNDFCSLADVRYRKRHSNLVVY